MKDYSEPKNRHERQALNLLVEILKTLPETEYRFHPTRKWRFDFAYPDKKIALEVEGGTWVGGRHINPIGFQKDCEKYNEAAKMGWKVYRCTPKMLTVEYITGLLV